MSTDPFPCPKCENEMFPGARFCMRCGTRLDVVGDVEAGPAPPTPHVSRPSGPPAPDPWANMPLDLGLEAIELSFSEAELRDALIAPKGPAPVAVEATVARQPPAAPQLVAAPAVAAPAVAAPAVAAPAVVPPATASPLATRSVPDSSRDGSRRRIDGMAEYSREDVLRRVRAKQSLKRAGLAGIDLSGANLEGVDFGRADFEGANLDDAKLTGAVLTNASLRGASLKRATLERANLSRADLEGAQLTDARLARACLERAALRGATLDRASLVEASLSGADLSDSLVSAADLSLVDARHAIFNGAVLNGVRFEGAKLFGATFDGAKVTTPRLEWIDVSAAGDGSQRLDPKRANGFLGGRRESVAPKMRYFGKGDVLRDATLEFGEGSVIHVDSRFENCLIALGEGAELTIGKSGVLKACEIVGNGRITVHGRFFERASPGISGARSVTVSGSGAIVGGLEQAEGATLFAFEPGCRLRVKILKPRFRAAAE
jgi:uncharacterized protein YjbI with pentapeptide repeats